MPKSAAKTKEATAEEIAAAQVAAITERNERETAAARIRSRVKELYSSVSQNALDLIEKEELDRSAKKQPRVDDKGRLFRAKGDEIVDMEAPDYWSKRYDFLPTKKVNQGEAVLALAAQAIDNLTAQAELVKLTGGIDAASKAMALVGGELGKKMLKPGAGPTKIPGAPEKDKNPWSAKAWNVTEQGRLARVLGLEKAKQICAAAGSTWGATKPPKA